METKIILIFIFILNCVSPLKSQTDPPRENHVIVVYNTNSYYGFSIANYYKSKRTIPSENIISISCDTSEVINRGYFNEYILNPLRDSIESRQNLKENTRFIVLTKGVPLKIIPPDIDPCKDIEEPSAQRTSLDARLCFIFDITFQDSIDLQYYPYRPNQYYYDKIKEYKHFESFKYLLPIQGDVDTMSYLVCRLDGYTLKDIYNMIDRSINSNLIRSNGNFTLDADPEPSHKLPPCDNMSRTKDSLLNLGQNVNYDNTKDPLKMDDSCNGYCSYGFNAHDYITRYNPLTIAPLVNGYGPVELNFPKFMNGAAFITYESWNAWSFYAEITGTCLGHNMQFNLLADFIKYGGTVSVGNVYEPRCGAVINEEIFFPAYVRGYPFIEAAYMSLPYANWRNVVVGDPLCVINN